MLTFFDIETKAYPDDVLVNIAPPFDPSEVKVGNTKDQAKIQEKMASAEAKHYEKYFQDAALNPMLSRILVIGVLQEGNEFVMLEGEEKDIIEKFWKMSVDKDGRLHDLIGFNNSGFDLPFIIKRGWKYGIRPPGTLRRGRYWSDYVCDIREVFNQYQYGASGTLNEIAEFLGLPKKTGKGSEFARLYDEDRSKAFEYVKRDVTLVKEIYDRIIGGY